MADVLLLGRTQICQVYSDRKLGGIHASLLTTAQRNACSALGIFHFAHWAGEAGGVVFVDDSVIRAIVAGCSCLREFGGLASQCRTSCAAVVGIVRLFAWRAANTACPGWWCIRVTWVTYNIWLIARLARAKC